MINIIFFNSFFSRFCSRTAWLTLLKKFFRYAAKWCFFALVLVSHIGTHRKGFFCLEHHGGQSQIQIQTQILLSLKWGNTNSIQMFAAARGTRDGGGTVRHCCASRGVKGSRYITLLANKSNLRCRKKRKLMNFHTLEKLRKLIGGSVSLPFPLATAMEDI